MKYYQYQVLQTYFIMTLNKSTSTIAVTIKGTRLIPIISSKAEIADRKDKPKK